MQQVIAAETLQAFLEQEQSATEEGSFAVLKEVRAPAAPLPMHPFFRYHAW
jgi:hypothetical protein